MLNVNSTATTPEESRAEPELEYNLQPWGDVIYGTKEQLQSIGLGAGIPFPGEAGETRKKIKVVDPRGFTATIDRASYKADGIFGAFIPFPGCDHPCMEAEWKSFYFGVKKRESVWWDEFTGTADALSAAGLVQISQLPGQPGMRKVAVTIHPDGTVATSNKARREGDRTIKKSGKTRYTVEVKVSDEEGERRLCAYQKEHKEWEERMAALPRPNPLHVSGKQIQPPKKKESYYSSPESFKKFALHWAGSDARSGGFEFVFSGEQELDECGEITMKLDDQSIKEIVGVYADFSARLTELVKAAKVVRARPHLSIVPSSLPGDTTGLWRGFQRSEAARA